MQPPCVPTRQVGRTSRFPLPTCVSLLLLMPCVAVHLFRRVTIQERDFEVGMLGL